jgi:SET domain
VYADQRKFIVQAILGKGLGVVATDPIDRGEVIISEAPLFTQGLARNEHTIAASLAPKSMDEKREYLRLANCRDSTKVNPLQGIFETNTLPCGDNMQEFGVTASKAGIFLLCSRFNSSCTPNVHNWWDEEGGVIVMRALKPIERGEELCICYGGEWQPRDLRQEKFRSKFGFTCTCTSCSLDGEALMSSDRRRTRLGILYHEIGSCADDPVLGVKKVSLLGVILGLLTQSGLA